MKKRLFEEWVNVLNLEKSSPYVFRTRLERAVNHTYRYALMEKDNLLLDECKLVVQKLQYISDQSNQTSDGCLNSFIVLKQDLTSIKNRLGSQSA